MVIALASVRRVVRVACGWLLLHACVLGTAGAATLVGLERDGDRVLVRGVAARSPAQVWLSKAGPVADIAACELDGDHDVDLVAMDGAAELSSHLPLQSVGLLVEVDRDEKHIIRRDFLPPARSPSPVGSPTLSPGLRWGGPRAAVPFSPRPPPRTV